MSEVLDNLTARAAQLDTLVAAYKEQAALCRENLTPQVANARISEMARAALARVKEIHFQTVEDHQALGEDEGEAARSALSHGRVVEVQQYFEREIAALAQ